jgi:hypothetical protein
VEIRGEDFLLDVWTALFDDVGHPHKKSKRLTARKIEYM